MPKKIPRKIFKEYVPAGPKQHVHEVPKVNLDSVIPWDRHKRDEATTIREALQPSAESLPKASRGRRTKRRPLLHETTFDEDPAIWSSADSLTKLFQDRSTDSRPLSHVSTFDKDSAIGSSADSLNSLTKASRDQSPDSRPLSHVTMFDEDPAISRDAHVSASRPTLLWHLTSLKHGTNRTDLRREWGGREPKVARVSSLRSGHDTTPWRVYQADVATIKKDWLRYTQRYHYGSDVQAGPTRLVSEEAWQRYSPSHVYAWKGPPAKAGE